MMRLADFFLWMVCSIVLYWVLQVAMEGPEAAGVSLAIMGCTTIYVKGSDAMERGYRREMEKLSGGDRG